MKLREEWGRGRGDSYSPPRESRHREPIPALFPGLTLLASERNVVRGAVTFPPADPGKGRKGRRSRQPDRREEIDWMS